MWAENIQPLHKSKKLDRSIEIVISPPSFTLNLYIHSDEIQNLFPSHTDPGD